MTITWSPLEQMFGLVGSNLRDSSEDVCTVYGRSLNTVAMIDLSVAGFLREKREVFTAMFPKQRSLIQ